MPPFGKTSNTESPTTTAFYQEDDLKDSDMNRAPQESLQSSKRPQPIEAEERDSKKQKQRGLVSVVEAYIGADEAGEGGQMHGGPMDHGGGMNTQAMEDAEALAKDDGDVEMGDAKDEEEARSELPEDEFVDKTVEQIVKRSGHSPTFPTFRTRVPLPPVLAEPIDRKQDKEEKWLLFSNSSPLIHTDIVELLETSWESISAEERDYLASLLPEVDLTYPPGSSKPLLCDRFFKTNSVFKQTCREYKDDLRDAFLDTDFMKDAVRAAKNRKQGKFDNWKDHEFEIFWGQKQKLPTDIVAGGAAKIPLDVIIRARYLQEGDIWHYFRSFSTGVKVEKEVKCIGVNPDMSLNFLVPAKDKKFCDEKKGPKDIVVKNVVKPQALETIILRQSTKCPSRIPNGNAFKVFRIVRNNLDKGALWELRQNYFERMGFE